MGPLGICPASHRHTWASRACTAGGYTRYTTRLRPDWLAVEMGLAAA